MNTLPSVGQYNISVILLGCISLPLFSILTSYSALQVIACIKHHLISNISLCRPAVTAVLLRNQSVNKSKKAHIFLSRWPDEHVEAALVRAEGRDLPVVSGQAGGPEAGLAAQEGRGLVDAVPPKLEAPLVRAAAEQAHVLRE